MARFHGHGSVLSKWSAPYLDRVVRASITALVSCGHGAPRACAGAGPDLRYLSAQTVAHRLLLRDYRLADWHYSDQQLCLPELHCLSLGIPVARRSILGPVFAAASAACRAFASHIGDWGSRNARLAESASSVGASDSASL